MRTQEELRKLSNIDPELDAIAKASGGGDSLPPPANINDYRTFVNGLYVQGRTAITDADSDFTEEDKMIAMRDGAEIAIRVHKKKSVGSNLPVIFFIHGGGMVSGNLDCETGVAKLWADMGGIMVSVDHRLAPEHEIPTLVNDCYDALAWVAKNASSLGGDLAKGFILGGYSSGASLAATLSHLWLQDKQSPAITGVYLVSPSLLPASRKKENLPEKYRPFHLSWEENKDAPFVPRSVFEFLESHLKTHDDSPLRCPILFESHKGLPPHYFQVAGFDPFRDDGLIYKEILNDSGVKTSIDIYPGVPHGFQYFFPTQEFSKKFWGEAKAGLESLLKKQ